jgi:hypothetical protein
LPVIIHPLDYVGPQASAPEGLCIINGDKLALLRKRFVNFVNAIAAEAALENETKIKEALHTHKLAESLFLSTYSVSP